MLRQSYNQVNHCDEMKFKNVSSVVRNKMCCGCGVCEDVCPVKSITISMCNGRLTPIVDNEKCLGEKCTRCLKVCSGLGVNFSDFKVNKDVDFFYDKYIGRYLGLYAGYSSDFQQRLHSASGGVVSQFLIYLLSKKIINGAVVTGFGDDRITPLSYIARSPQEVSQARSSKYCPVSLNKLGNEIVNSGGKYVIVGLPCHIQSFRKRSIIDRKFRENVVGYFSLYCSSGRTFYGRDYLLRKFAVSPQDVTYFSYRDNGCLGNMTIKQKDNTKELSIPFTKYYGPILRSFFKPHRCLTCIDHYGELSDVSFGDIHTPPYSEDKTGISSWIVRNPFWNEMFLKAREEGVLVFNEIETDILNKSQSAMLYPKQRLANAIMQIDRLFGYRTPVYDVSLEKTHFKDYLNALNYHFQRFLGRHKSLWGLIDFININK